MSLDDALPTAVRDEDQRELCRACVCPGLAVEKGERCLAATLASLFPVPCLCFGGCWLYQTRRDLRAVYEDNFNEESKTRDLFLSVCCVPYVIVQHERFRKSKPQSELDLDSVIANDLRLNNEEDRAALREGCSVACLRVRFALALGHYPRSCISCCPSKPHVSVNPSATTPLQETRRKVVLIGPANCGKSTLQAKLLLDTQRQGSPALRYSPYTEPEPEGDGAGSSDPFHSTQPPHIRTGVIATGFDPAGARIRYLEVVDVPYVELLRHLEFHDMGERGLDSPLIESIVPKASAVCLCFDAGDVDGNSLAVLREVFEDLKSRYSPRRLPLLLVCLKMDLVAATGSAADFAPDPAEPGLQPPSAGDTSSAPQGSSVRRKNDREGGGVVARGLREQRLASLLREAGEWAREEGARICEVSSFANTGVRELRTLLDSMGGAPA